MAFVAYHSILLLLLFVSPDNIPTNNKKRILDEPLNVRFHYGHPDLFNKTVVMTRGGMAKASKGINLSEDIFSGFNYTLRGKNSTQSDFVQVGKGKDVGFTQISLFNAKISMGNAEQVISRDLNRLAQQFSFLRSFSLYYTCVGSFLGQVLVVISIWCVVYILDVRQKLPRSTHDLHYTNGRIRGSSLFPPIHHHDHDLHGGAGHVARAYGSPRYGAPRLYHFLRIPSR